MWGAIVTDDIVTKLEFLLKEGAAIIKDQADEIEDLQAELTEFQLQYQALKHDRDKWQAIANRLGTHMGEALYGDNEWPCREYAISAYSEWEKTTGAHLYAYQQIPQPHWYFRNGKET